MRAGDKAFEAYRRVVETLLGETIADVPRFVAFSRGSLRRALVRRFAARPIRVAEVLRSYRLAARLAAQSA
jgi:hypothetical protein